MVTLTNCATLSGEGPQPSARRDPHSMPATLATLEDARAGDLVQLFKLLADETRLQILHYLRQTEELNVRTWLLVAGIMLAVIVLAVIVVVALVLVATARRQARRASPDDGFPVERDWEDGPVRRKEQERPRARRRGGPPVVVTGAPPPTRPAPPTSAPVPDSFTVWPEDERLRAPGSAPT